MAGRGSRDDALGLQPNFYVSQLRSIVRCYRGCVGVHFSCGMRMTLPSHSNVRTTRGACTTCWRRGLLDTDWSFILRRRGCWTFVVRDIGAMMILLGGITAWVPGRYVMDAAVPFVWSLGAAIAGLLLGAQVERLTGGWQRREAANESVGTS
jgi:hypothetical protein